MTRGRVTTASPSCAAGHGLTALSETGVVASWAKNHGKSMEKTMEIWLVTGTWLLDDFPFHKKGMSSESH